MSASMDMTALEYEYLNLKLKNTSTQTLSAHFGLIPLRNLEENLNLNKHLAQLRIEQDRAKADARTLVDAEKELVRQLRHSNNITAAKAAADCLQFLAECMADPTIDISEKIKIALRLIGPAIKHNEKLAELSAEKSFGDEQATERTPLPEVE